MCSLCNKAVFLKQIQKLEEKERDLAKQDRVQSMYMEQIAKLEEKVRNVQNDSMEKQQSYPCSWYVLCFFSCRLQSSPESQQRASKRVWRKLTNVSSE